MSSTRLKQSSIDQQNKKLIIVFNVEGDLGPTCSDLLFHHTHVHTHFTFQFGFVYIFNLVIGVGALALPKAFSQAGLILGTLLLLILAFVSYVTATYMVEAMSIANAYMKYRARTKSPQLSTNTSTIQRDLGVRITICIQCINILYMS